TIVVPQEEINIEISNSFSNAFKQGYKKVILVQNNCPEFSKAELEEANEALDYNELTIGPSDDDAYYLIGMTANYPVLFEGINFQEDEVLTSC
ncbi:MAG: DUF2064 domain-containing protein, partial [Alphaproteobacteria bacterium]|nr:DUF2064 domain-containing protein [Alphaproteobacteria bacterium]